MLWHRTPALDLNREARRFVKYNNNNNSNSERYRGRGSWNESWKNAQKKLNRWRMLCCDFIIVFKRRWFVTSCCQLDSGLEPGVWGLGWCC